MDYNLSMIFAEKLYKILPASIIKKLQPKIMSIVAKQLHIVGQSMNYVDINVVDHCNLKCKYCANFCPLVNEKFLDVAGFDKDCERLSALSSGKIKTIRLLGGEPLLHPLLIEIMMVTRKHFPLSEIDLVTNGILLLKIPMAFWTRCEAFGIRVAISHYPIKLNYVKIKSIAKEYGVKTVYGKKPRGMYKWLLDINGCQDIKESHAYCIRANQCAVLQEGKIYACSLPPWIRYFNEYFGKDLRVNEFDYIDIYKAKNFAEVLEFLGKPIPFCKYCNTKKIVYVGNIKKGNNRMDIIKTRGVPRAG
ncbi:MAG: radical SAM protein [Treponema sp.]|jgi:sulfatase maturation enzyme AslB (radical SAM superfamily)|nr:radical SAM protein [Treponema sp.]